MIESLPAFHGRTHVASVHEVIQRAKEPRNERVVIYIVSFSSCRYSSSISSLVVITGILLLLRLILCIALTLFFILLLIELSSSSTPVGFIPRSLATLLCLVVQLHPHAVQRIVADLVLRGKKELHWRGRQCTALWCGQPEGMLHCGFSRFCDKNPKLG